MFPIRLLFALCALATLGQALKQTADCQMEAAVKKCIKSGFLLERIDKKQKSLPTNIADMNELCGNVAEGEKCVSDFVQRCVDTDKERRALTHSIEGAVRLIKRVCRTKAKKNEFLRNVSVCGNAVLSDGTQCLDTYKKFVVAAKTKTDKHEVLQLVCCKAYDVSKCIGQKMRAKGEETCSSANIDYMKKIQQGFNEELLSVLCADYERESKNCASAASIGVPSVDVGRDSLISSLKAIAEKVIN